MRPPDAGGEPAGVQLTHAAARDLDALPTPAREQVLADIQSLERAPLGAPPRIKRLKGFGLVLYRLRSGDYRVLYRLDDGGVTVMRVIDRKDLTRSLLRLRGAS